MDGKIKSITRPGGNEDRKGNRMKKTVNIKELGWNGNATATLNKYGCYEWTDSHDTMWEYNPETREARHCGTGEGCFWTDWE